MIKITNFASYVPSKTISNQDIIEKMSPGLNEKILYRAVGAKNKYVATNEEMGFDLMAEVGKKLLAEAKISPLDVDKLICSCDPVDQAAPDSSVLTQQRIGLSCPSFCISMSCVGWICALRNAIGLLKSGDRTILTIASSTVGSKYPFNSPMHRAIFGDGAGGALIRSNADSGFEILAIDLLTIGQHFSDIYAPMPWSNVPEAIPVEFKKYFYMANDNQIFFKALDKHIKPFYTKQFEVAGVKPEDIKLFIVHQASMPIFNYTVKSFLIPPSKVANYYEEYGNTIAAELPIITDRELRSNNIKNGDLIYYLTYGAGFTAGAMITRLT